MKVLFALFFVAFVYGCEDTKNTSVEKEKTTPTSETTKKKNEEISDVKSSEEKTLEYPIINKENVVEFLTQYGAKNPETSVKISTRLGDIYLELYKDTPLHRANFIYLVKQEYFNETFFHRVVPNFIIQGGNSDLPSTNKKRAAVGATFLLPAEINGRNVSYGSLTGAKEYRENPDKKSVPFEFFIFLGPISSTTHLNGNYTVFGKVTEGMDVVEKISELNSDDGEWPLQNVYLTAEVIK